MRKIILGLSILSSLFFLSCNKDENVAKDFIYTVDEEFLNNDRGWNVSDLVEGESVMIDASENGLYKIVTQKIVSDFTEASLSVDEDFLIETAFTITDTSRINKSFSGVSWNHVDTENYMLFAINENLDVDERAVVAKFVISEVINGKDPEKNILFEGSVVRTIPAVYTLGIDRTGNSLVFRVNGTVVKELESTDLVSSNVGVYSKLNDVNFHFLRTGK
jgi:hypothetical protein